MTTSGIRPTDHPVLRSDIVTRSVGNEVVAWPEGAEAPTYLDPVAALLAPMLDGSATVAELVEDVEVAFDISLELAHAHVARSLSILSAGRLLEPATTSPTHWATERRLLPQPDW